MLTEYMNSVYAQDQKRNEYRQKIRNEIKALRAKGASQ